MTLCHGVAVATGRLVSGCALAESRPAKVESEMAGPGWKAMLREPHAAGWIGLIVLVVLIGFAALYFSGGKSSDPSQPPMADHAER